MCCCLKKQVLAGSKTNDCSSFEGQMHGILCTKGTRHITRALGRILDRSFSPHLSVRVRGPSAMIEGSIGNSGLNELDLVLNLV